jgi:ribulose 1,5-bisphosphate synthetase/thiazole synthase
MRGRCKPDPAVLEFGAVLRWRSVTLSAKLMVDPRNGARAVIRDTGSDAGG